VANNKGTKMYYSSKALKIAGFFIKFKKSPDSLEFSSSLILCHSSGQSVLAKEYLQPFQDLRTKNMSTVEFNFLLS
jgi:hypothetical protein